MSYLWENYSVDNNYELAVRGFSPYLEIFKNVSGNVKVNILYRFADIYSKILDSDENFIEKYEKDVKLREAFHIFFHMLANIDFYSGITGKEAYMIKIEKEISSGRYGIDSELFAQLLFEHKYALLSYLCLKIHHKNRRCFFFDFLSEVFGAESLYSEWKDTYIVQIGCSKELRYGENEGYCAEQLYELAKELLCDFWLAVEVYWEIPIGVICESMRIDHIQII